MPEPSSRPVKASVGGFKGSHMKRTYQLVKLRVETAQDLKRLMAQTGQGSLDGLVAAMIRLMDAHRLGLKEAGWYVQSNRGAG